MIRAPLSRLASLLISFYLLVLVVAGFPGEARASSSLQNTIHAEATQSRGHGSSDALGMVVERLRVKVPASGRQAWRLAEEESWGPWLRRQDGFLGRELLWDGEREEGLLLIRWRSRDQWLAIPASEIEAVQRQFEAAAHRALALDPTAQEARAAANPFPLINAGELESVGFTPAADSEAVW